MLAIDCGRRHLSYPNELRFPRRDGEYRREGENFRGRFVLVCAVGTLPPTNRIDLDADRLVARVSDLNYRGARRLIEADAHRGDSNQAGERGRLIENYYRCSYHHQVKTNTSYRHSRSSRWLGDLGEFDRDYHSIVTTSVCA